MLLEFWEEPDVPAAQRYFAQSPAEAMGSGLESIKKVTRTLRDSPRDLELLSQSNHQCLVRSLQLFPSSSQGHYS